MRGLAASCLVLLCASGAGQDIAKEDLLLRILCDVEEVEFGKAFALGVQRTWRKDLVPDDWDAAALAPLKLKLINRSRREDETRIEETLSFDAYLFSRGAVQIPAIEFTAHSQDRATSLQVLSNTPEIRVRSLLDPEDPGNAELPGGPMTQPASNNLLLGSLLAVLALLSIVAWSFWQRSHGEAAGTRKPTLSPGERATRRIAGLRDSEPKNLAEIRAFHVEASAALRCYLEEEYALPAPESTSEELLASPRSSEALSTAQRDLLAAFLANCDRVKFAQGEPGEVARRELLDTATEFLAEKGRA